MVGSGIRVSLVENDNFGWACLQATCFQEKGRDRQRTRVEEGGTETSRGVNTS